jgi:predicted peptidase
MTFILAMLMSVTQEPEASGVHERVLTREGRSAVRYTLLIPSPYDPAQKYPLIVALHYAGQMTPFFGKGILLGLVQPALRELAAIVVAPDAPGKSWDEPESEAAVLDLMEHIQKRYPIDPRRIVLTGYSLGGRGTWYLASRHPELFSAALPLAGSPPRDLKSRAEALSKIPLYLIHSRRDEIVPLGPTEDAVRLLRAAGARVELVVLSGVTHYETARFVEPLKAAVPWIRSVWGTP